MPTARPPQEWGRRRCAGRRTGSWAREAFGEDPRWNRLRPVEDAGTGPRALSPALGPHPDILNPPGLTGNRRDATHTSLPHQVEAVLPAEHPLAVTALVQAGLLLA